MQRWLRLAEGIDRFSEKTGRLLYWLTLGMVLIGAYNAIVRYLDRFTGLGLSSNTYIELQWYLFSLVFLLGGAYTLLRDAHVRVDVLYGRLSRRTRAVIDIVGIEIFLVPFCLVVIWESAPAVGNSWAVWEMSPDPGGLPRYPIKTLVPVAFALVLLQGVAEWIKRLAFLLGHDLGNGAASDPHDEAPATVEGV